MIIENMNLRPQSLLKIQISIQNRQFVHLWNQILNLKGCERTPPFFFVLASLLQPDYYTCIDVSSLDLCTTLQQNNTFHMDVHVIRS
jgi:hypothetical protein